jgi:hypothetical protein
MTAGYSPELSLVGPFAARRTEGRLDDRTNARAESLQCAFAQQTGMPLAGPGKFDDLLGDDCVRKIVCKPKGCARHFKRDMEISLGFGIGVEGIQVGRDSHGKTPAKGNFVNA